MVPSNYECVPGIQTANFELPFAIDLEGLSQFFRKRKMKTKIQATALAAPVVVGIIDSAADLALRKSL